MKMYQIGKVSLIDDLRSQPKYKSGLKLSGILSFMSGFVAISHDKLVFSRPTESASLVEVSTEFPLMHSYQVTTQTKSGLRMHQAVVDWMELQQTLKEDYQLADGDRIMYIHKAGKRFFVKTKNTYSHLKQVDPKKILAEIRGEQVATDMTDVLDGLYKQYSREELPFKKMVYSTRIKALLSTMTSQGLVIPERYMQFQNINRNVGDSSVDFD